MLKNGQSPVFEEDSTAAVREIIAGLSFLFYKKAFISTFNLKHELSIVLVFNEQSAAISEEFIFFSLPCAFLSAREITRNSFRWQTPVR